MTEAEKEKVLEGLGMVRAGVGFVSHPNVQADDKKRIDAAIALVQAQDETIQSLTRGIVNVNDEAVATIAQRDGEIERLQKHVDNLCLTLADQILADPTPPPQEPEKG